ncbi:MAG: lysozyme inhibitor LprI family protein [Pyrinomonadaceae bacterium]
MRTNRIIACALLTHLLLTAAGAKTQKQREIQPCEGNGSQAEASGCAHREYLAADAELNKTYNRLAGVLDADEKALLKESELAWIKYRDSNCTFESSQYAGGTMRPMIESFCLARVTRARTAELKEQYELRK